jgi:hypothetical protein
VTLIQYSRAPVPAESVSAVYSGPNKKFENERNKQFICFKTCSKQERTVTWWNPAAQTHPVLDSSFFAPILTLPHRTCLHSASSVLIVHISCCVIAVYVFRKHLFIDWTLPYVCLLHKYHIYSIQYHLWIPVFVVAKKPTAELAQCCTLLWLLWF